MRGISAIVMACLLLGCSGNQGGSVPEDAVRKIVGFQKVTLSFHIGTVGKGRDCGQIGYTPPNQIEYVAAEKLGYISVKPGEKGLWKIDLTDSGRSTLESLKRKPHDHFVGHGCDNEQVDFTLAQKTLVSTTGTQTKGPLVESEYTWKWAPTDTGAKLANVGLSDTQIADLNHALGYQVYADDYFSFPVAENVTHPGKMTFEKKGEHWMPVIK